MKILLVNQHVHDVVGGSEIHSDLVARQLTGRGHEVVYGVALPQSRRYPTAYRCERLKKPFTLSLARTLRDFRPQVVYWEYNKKGLLAAVLLSKLFGAAFVFHISHRSDTERWIYSGTRVFEAVDRDASLPVRLRQGLLYLQWPLRSALNYFGYLLVDASITTQSELANRLPVERERRIYYAVPAEEEAMPWPRPYVLWAARIRRKKNPEEYLALAEALTGSGIDFLMAGEIQDDEYAFLEDNQGLPADFHYLGLLSPEQVNGLLRNALFLVHTCNPEGFGLVFIQAWLRGRPTVSLYHDPEDLITEEGLGFVSRSPAQLHEDVGRLLTDPDFRETLGERAFRFARDQFTPDANGAQIEEFLREVVG